MERSDCHSLWNAQLLIFLQGAQGMRGALLNVCVTALPCNAIFFPFACEMPLGLQVGMRIAAEKGVSVLTVIHDGTLNSQVTCRIAFSGLEFKEGI